MSGRYVLLFFPALAGKHTEGRKRIETLDHQKNKME
jgi:hypothetical protein